VLSALLLSKSKGLEGMSEDTPIEAKLGPAIEQALSRATAPTRKRMLAVSRVVWSRLIGRMKATNLPLFWPQSLGGWGLPGKQQANAKWRKIAAILVTLKDGQRPNFQSILRRTPRTELDELVDATIQRVYDRANTVRVLQRGKHGCVKAAIVTVPAVPPGPRYGGQAFSAGSKLFQTASVGSIKSKRVGTRWVDGEMIPPDFLDYTELPYTGTELSERLWAGMPKSSLTPILKTQLATALRSGPVASSAPKKGAEKTTLRDRTNRMVVVANRVLALRPGVNPAAARNAKKLAASQRKVSSLYELQSVEQLCNALGLSGTVEKVLLSVQEKIPATALWCEGRIRIMKPDGTERLAWGEQSQAGDVIDVVAKDSEISEYRDHVGT
jgi:hypothetical protein